MVGFPCRFLMFFCSFSGGDLCDKLGFDTYKLMVKAAHSSGFHPFLLAEETGIEAAEPIRTAVQFPGPLPTR